MVDAAENQWESGYREDGRSANGLCPGTSLSLNWKRLAVMMDSASSRECEDALYRVERERVDHQGALPSSQTLKRLQKPALPSCSRTISLGTAAGCFEVGLGSAGVRGSEGTHSLAESAFLQGV